MNLRRLKIGQLTQLLNSARGTASRAVLMKHRDLAGLLIGDGNTIDLFKYAAWLHRQRHAPPDAKQSAYELHRAKQAKKQREASLAGRDIGPIPAVAQPDRRKRCRRNFRDFCALYMPETFYMKWSPHHLRVIKKIERAVLRGDLFALAMPRGSGKTALIEAAAIWALVYAWRHFVVIIGADEDAAETMLDSMKMELETNDRLAEDFPEVCFPIRQLEGIRGRAAGQLCEGKRTYITWTRKEVILPTVKGHKTSGAVLRISGITGRVRGMKSKTVTNETIRPDLVLVDDPQTDQSARSEVQVAARESILMGAVLGMAGPGKDIAGLAALTIVRPGDLAARILNREDYPEWSGERLAMLESFPTNEDLWAEYANIRQRELDADRGIEMATKFYLSNRAEMDAGAVVTWEERYNPDEASALQHAMNLKLRNEAVFFAEYQNDPQEDIDEGVELLEVEKVQARVNNYNRRLVPADVSMLTAFIDVQKRLLYYVVVGWTPHFSGYVIDYGTEPEQPFEHFLLRNVTRTIRRGHSRGGVEGAIYGGLKALCTRLFDRDWKRDGGGFERIGRALVDANWGESTDVIYKFIREQVIASGVLLPSHGKYVGATSSPLVEPKRQAGETVGLNWRLRLSKESHRRGRRVIYDANFWKTFCSQRLRVPMGNPGSLSLFGQRPSRHRMIAEHCCAEYPILVEAKERQIEEWKPKGNQDNHFWDCLVGNCVAASVAGISLAEQRPPNRNGKKVSFAERQRKARARRS